jgi:hypothetical protein
MMDRHVAVLALGLLAAIAARAEELSFPLLNRTYTDLVSDFAPIRQGPMTLTLSSPNQKLTVRRHGVRLTRRPDGAFDAAVEVEVMGKGWLVGDIDFSGASTRLQDELILLPQTLTLDGRAQIERSTDGYRVEVLSAPSQVALRISSKLANEVVTWCDRVALIPFTRLDCRALERSLATVNVPLPAAGESYLLADRELRPEDRAQLDALLKTK